MTPRSLRYPLKNPITTTSSIPYPGVFDPVSNWPSGDPDEIVQIVIELTLNEYVKLASCIDVGRDIAYPEGTEFIWWLWNRVLMTDLCQTVADCVDNSPAVKSALDVYVSSSPVLSPNYATPTTVGAQRNPESSQPVRTPPEPCDLDALWAGCREIVERIDQLGRDVLEDASVPNDVIQQIANAIAFVPILGQYIADVGEFFLEAVPDLLNAYNAYSSPVSIDNAACDLFDMVCEECRYPTYDEVYAYFASRSVLGIPPTFPPATYQGVWDAVKAVPAASGNIVWHTINTWLVFTLSFDAYFGQSYGKKSIGIWASFGEDLPNDNWKTLCDACAGVLRRYGGYGDASITYLQGSYDSALDRALSSPNAGDGFAYVEIRWDFDQPVTGNVLIDYLWDSTRTGVSNWGSIQVFDQFGQIDSALLTAQGSTGSQRGVSLANATHLQIFMNVRSQNSGDGAFGAIDGIELTLA